MMNVKQQNASRCDFMYHPTRVRDLPPQWFIPSENLQQDGWLDFSLRSQADWESSSSPIPESPNDCCLVLAYARVIPPIAQINDWAVVHHETGGIWQERRRIVAKKLAIEDSGLRIIHSIARRMARSNCSAEYALFDQLSEYRNLLNEFGLDCNHHIQTLAEGFYPIDVTKEALAILTIIDPAASLFEGGSDERLCLSVLAPNSSDW